MVIYANKYLKYAIGYNRKVILALEKRILTSFFFKYKKYTYLMLSRKNTIPLRCINPNTIKSDCPLKYFKTLDLSVKKC